jgi:Holliday junction resolvasome RuvABC endonuclease subunit
MILGLDISTSRIGITVMKENEELVFCEVFKTNKNHSLSERCLELEKFIKELKYEFRYIFIEAPFMMFAGGKTTAHTMAKLQRFNGMCSYMVRRSFGIEPLLIPANKARKLVGISVKRGMCTKTKVIKFVQQKYPSFQVYYTRHGNPKPGTDDKADSVVIALAGIKMGDINV